MSSQSGGLVFDVNQDDRITVADVQALHAMDSPDPALYDYDRDGDIDGTETQALFDAVGQTPDPEPQRTDDFTTTMPGSDSNSGGGPLGGLDPLLLGLVAVVIAVVVLR
jgi:hypothetical protein